MASGDPIKATDTTVIAQAANTKAIVRLIGQLVQSIPNATNTALTFGAGSEDIDTDNYHDTASNTSRITPTVAGYYELRGYYVTGSNAGTISASIAKTGTRVPSGDAQGTTAASARGVGASAILTANGSTDYFELHALQTSGAAVNTNVSVQFTSAFEMEFLRPL